MKRQLTALTLAAAMLFALPACGGEEVSSAGTGTDLMGEMTMAPYQGDWEEYRGSELAEFSLRLFRAAAEEGENTLLSPYSILCALGMTANGASGETQEQMEEVLGLDLSRLNTALHDWIEGQGEELQGANAIWIRDKEGFTVEQSFLEANAGWYGAGAYTAPFGAGTVEEINSWVTEQTGGQITEILEEIPPEAVMYLVNALSFDAEWQEIYRESQIRTGTFTAEDGTAREVELMYSEEGLFLEGEKVTGFLKYYAGGRYAFAALLPREGVSVAGCLASLTGEELTELLTGARRCMVRAAIPKFEVEYDTELSKALSALGMGDAFDPSRADFSALGHSADGNLYISRVLHKTALTLDERGTKAGAVTAVEVNDESAPLYEEIQQVYLDRPFIYLIVDTETNAPLFLGTAMDLGEELVEPDCGFPD